MLLNFIFISMSLSLAKAVTLELFELPEHSYPNPEPYCNDGTQAGYYHDTDLSKLSKIHVHLQGGAMCESDEDCVKRCDKDGDGVVDARGLFTNYSIIDETKLIFLLYERLQCKS